MKQTRWFHFILVVSLLFFAGDVLAQQQVIRGYVYDGQTGEPLSNGIVWVKGTQQGVVTNAHGFFVFDSIAAGTHVLEARYLGYDTLAVNLRVDSGHVVSHQFYLEPAAHVPVITPGPFMTDSGMVVRIERIEIGKIPLPPYWPELHAKVPRSEFSPTKAIGATRLFSEHLRLAGW